MPRAHFANSYKLLLLGSNRYSCYAQYCHALQQIPSLCLLPWTLHEGVGSCVCSSIPAGLVCLSGG